MTEYSKPVLIAAIGGAGEIGFKGNLPWYIPEDLKFFKETTLNSLLIMGRKTWEGLPGLLSKRNFAVISSSDIENIPEGRGGSFKSYEEAVAYAEETEQKAFVAGGAQLYEYVLKNNLVDRMIITHVRANFEADTYFPEYDTKKWNGVVLRTGFATDASPAFDIVDYTRR